MPKTVRVYYKQSDMIKNAVDLVVPKKGATHKSTKAALYDVCSNKPVGYMTIDIRGEATPDKLRTRSCQANITIGQNFKLNFPYGNVGLFKNTSQQNNIVANDFNGVKTTVRDLTPENAEKKVLSITQFINC
jgi:hypothetical protein